jgi:hypothetical protein
MAPAARDRRLALGYRGRFGPVAARPTSSLTHLCHWTTDFAVMNSCVPMPRRGYVRGAHRRDYIMLPWHVRNVAIDTQMDT